MISPAAYIIMSAVDWEISVVKNVAIQHNYEICFLRLVHVFSTYANNNDPLAHAGNLRL